jgi:DNA-directed RNA polymerase specialized sigma24 family protein
VISSSAPRHDRVLLGEPAVVNDMRRHPSISRPGRAVSGDERLEDLVDKTLEGDGGAWRELWLAVEPMLTRISASYRLTSRLSLRDDERRDVVLRVMNLLREDDFRRLRRFRTARDVGRATTSFRSWLATVAVRSAISHVREHAEYLGHVGGARWAEFVRAPALVDERAIDPTPAFEGRALLERARSILRPAQLDALLLWLVGADHAEIARDLGLDGDAAAGRLVHAALKRLRDRFGRPARAP